MLHPMRYPCALSTDEIRRAQVRLYRVSLLRTLSPHPPPKRTGTVFDDLRMVAASHATGPAIFRR